MFRYLIGSVIFEIGLNWVVFAAAHALVRQRMHGFAVSYTGDSLTKSRLRIPPSQGLLAALKIVARRCCLLQKHERAEIGTILAHRS